MQKMFLLFMGIVLAFATLEAQSDPDFGGTLLGRARIGDAVEGTTEDTRTHLEPRNVNISAVGWDSIRDSALLRVQGKNANAAGGANSQAFAVVACDRTAADDTASISLMRVANPREVVTSTNNSAAGQAIGNIARTAARFRAEGKGETLYAVLTTPELNGVIDAGWQVGSGGYRTLNVTLLDTFNGGGVAANISFSLGCGQSLFPF